MTTITDQLFVLLQRMLPKYLLTSLVHRIARLRNVAVKDFLIRRFVSHYGVDVSDVKHPVPDGYATFNDFFIRELSPGARPIDAGDDSIVSPVDGTVSAAGLIRRERLIQAKGVSYSLTDLLATDTIEAQRFVDGAFATIYLAPYNYHRIHAPLASELVAMRYVPGALFSVNHATVRQLPRLFARNERLICQFSTNFGPLAMILVGALNVGTIGTPWTGNLRPRSVGSVEPVDLRGTDSSLALAKGDTIGWFNMGSTVILLLPPATSDNFVALESGLLLRMGQVIGRMNGQRG